MLSFASECPHLTTEASHRIIDIFKSFNHLTCKLILGAEAMKTAGLKSISAKHLGAAMQAISLEGEVLRIVETRLLFSLLPLHREILAPQFRCLGRDLASHHTQIVGKLVGIMEDRMLSNLRVLPTIAASWKDDDQEAQPSQFARTVCKQVELLKGALHEMLLPDELDAVFGSICEIYSDRLSQTFRGFDNTKQKFADLNAVWQCLRALPVSEEIKAAKLAKLEANSKED